MDTIAAKEAKKKIEQVMHAGNVSRSSLARIQIVYRDLSAMLQEAKDLDSATKIQEETE